MKKKTKRNIIIGASALAVLCIAGGAYVYRMFGAMKDMSALDTGEILPGIYAVHTGNVNMYLIKTGDTYIAVDAGGSDSAVRKGLAELGVSAGDVTAVLMTHAHGDHTAGLKQFNNAAVYGAEGRIASRLITDGETFTVNGAAFRVIAAPGHTDDSVCYLYDDKYLFTGDNLSLHNGRVGMFVSFFNKSDDQQRLDIEKISKIDAEYVITAHYRFAQNPVFP